MIVYSFGRYLSQTVHDHEPCPKCLNLKFGHNGYNGGISEQGSSSRTPHHSAPAPPPSTRKESRKS